VTQTIEQLNSYWELLLKVNEPEPWEEHSSEVLRPEVINQLRAISEYSYLDVDGQLKPLVSPEEMAQLMITKGNLTPAERLAVEAHVTHSYEFLKRIPWTPHLQDIPIIAYCHHEKLDGSGYPRALKQPDIPFKLRLSLLLIFTTLWQPPIAPTRTPPRGNRADYHASGSRRQQNQPRPS